MTDFARHILEETEKLTALSDEEKAVKLEKFYQMVVDFNEKVNLTAITEPEDFLRKHFLDSLVLIADNNVSRETFGGKNNNKIVSRETITRIDDQNIEHCSEHGTVNDNVSRETIDDSTLTTVFKAALKTEENKTDDVSRETKRPGETEGNIDVSGSQKERSNVSRETLVRNGARIIDVGTGAGFPGIPLAIYRKDLKVTLLDSLNKRVTFLKDTVKELGLKNCEAIHSRAEDLAHQPNYREKYDICISRAVAALPVLCEYCLPYVKKGGYFVSYKASGAGEEVKAADKAIKVLGGKLHSIETVVLPGTDIERKLIIIKKVENTPKKYPRKAGTPAKSPLA